MVIAVMYWNEIMSQKARTIVAKLRRRSRVRPYRERTEITPLLTTSSHKNGMSNGISNGTTVHIDNQLYPIDEIVLGEFR